MTYNSFIWELKWFDYICGLETMAEKISLLDAIVEYGIYENAKSDLSGQAQDYFNNVVKPSLDKSHARYLKKLERKAKRSLEYGLK